VWEVEMITLKKQKEKLSILFAAGKKVKKKGMRRVFD